MTTIATIVEGSGEVATLPLLIRRIATELMDGIWLDVPRPHRVGRDKLVKSGGIEAAVDQAVPGAGVLILIDADDDCPAGLGPDLLSRARKARPDKLISVVLANREFEAWFLAAAPSLRGVGGLPTSLELPADCEKPRGCKEWLSERRVDGQKYKPSVDQAALTARIDLRMARVNSPSFDKLCRELSYLATGNR